MAQALAQPAIAYVSPAGQTPQPRLAGADRIKAIGREFEAVFLSAMFEEMFASLDDEDPLGGGPGAEAWRSMRTEEFARAIAASGGVGLADHVQRQLIALQEYQS